MSKPVLISQTNIHNKLNPESNRSAIISKPVNRKFSMVKEKNMFFDYVFLSSSFESTQPRDFRLLEDVDKDARFIATAYDLSFKSCGKYPGDPTYGITFSGKKAIKGVTIAVDPEIIPLGSNVHIEFEDQYSYLNGWYVAEDTGKKVKGYIIDIFFGKSAFYEMEKFGSRPVRVKILN